MDNNNNGQETIIWILFFIGWIIMFYIGVSGPDRHNYPDDISEYEIRDGQR